MNLQEMRLKAGLSQGKLSKASGVSVRTIQQYERGARNIDGASLETLCDLSLAIGCKLTDILESESLKEKIIESMRIEKAPE